jgi:1-phosphatidylinositol phosphodiesterase
MKEITTKNWMSNLDSELTLDKISIPGTHDSGTSEVSKGPAHTQNFDIITQLNDGIRFLDIRVKHRRGHPDDPLQIYHGIINCDISFRDVLVACTEFLKDNPQETIIMLVNSASGKDKNIQIDFDKYIENDQYPHLFYLEPTLPSLKELRGKVVLFRRFSGNKGVDLSKDWGKNDMFSLDTPQGVTFKIEDKYEEHDTEKKFSYVEKNIGAAIDNPDDGFIYITYNSISFSLFGHTPYQYAWGGGIGRVDPKMNPKLKDYLKGNSGNKRFGVIMLDFYNDKEGSINNDNCKLIINSNTNVKLSATKQSLAVSNAVEV